MSKQKAKGTFWESAIVKYLKENGYPETERRTLSGAKDRGDIYIPRMPLVIEAKNQARITLAEWIDETKKEAKNADVPYGVCWFKRKGKTSPGDAYVVMDGETFINFLGQIEDT